jgi:hypothetical protein
MAKFILPEEKSTPYREMLRDLFFTKANDFDASGHYVCKLCCPQILILQRIGTGMSSLTRHVTAFHHNHREVPEYII